MLVISIDSGDGMCKTLQTTLNCSLLLDCKALYCNRHPHKVFYAVLHNVQAQTINELRPLNDQKEKKALIFI